MTEPYSKLTNIQPLSQQTLESLERFQQQMTNAIEPYKKIANMMSSYTEKISEISNTLSPGITQLIEMQQRYNEMMQPIVENLNIRINNGPITRYNKTTHRYLFELGECEP